MQHRPSRCGGEGSGAELGDGGLQDEYFVLGVNDEFFLDWRRRFRMTSCTWDREPSANGLLLPRNAGYRSSLSCRALTLSLVDLASFSKHRRQNISPVSISLPQVLHRLARSLGSSSVNAAESSASSGWCRLAKQFLHTSRSQVRTINAWHSGQFVSSSLIKLFRLSGPSVLVNNIPSNSS